MSALILFEGWELDASTPEVPRVRDLDVATRGGMRRPRDIRQLIERNRKELEMYGPLEVCGVAPQTSGGRPGHEYWLTADQTAAIIGFMRTPFASAFRVTLTKLFVAYHAKRMPGVESAPIQARIGDDTRAADFLRATCRMAAKLSGRSVQSIQGELRKPWGVASVYRIALSSLSHTMARAQEIADDALRHRRLPAYKRQGELPFSKPN
jgi:hypothetical protein